MSRYFHCHDSKKRGYQTRHDADRVRHSMFNSDVLHAYLCSACGRWHLGHIRGWRRRKPVLD